jgi:hypothetical protein
MKKFLRHFGFWVSLVGVIAGSLSLAIDGFSAYRVLILTVNFLFLCFWAIEDAERLTNDQDN